MSILDLLGPTAVPTIICLLIGLTMLVLEMFTPGVGIHGGVGVLSLLTVVILQLGWGSPTVGLIIVAIVLVLILLMLLWFVRSFQKGRLSRSFLVLQDSVVDTAKNAEQDKQEDALLGRMGKSLTALRPSGTAEIDGKRINVTTDGTFIPAGRAITVIRTNGLDILVAEATLPANDSTQTL